MEIIEPKFGDTIATLVRGNVDAPAAKSSMKFWILEPIDTESEDSPWNPWYDKFFGFVVAAETETQARQLAQNSGGRELHDDIPLGQEPRKLWLDASMTTCSEIIPSGEARVVMSDLRSA